MAYRYLIFTPLLVLFGCTEPRIDTSTNDAMETSLEEVRASLPESERDEFDEALQVLAFEDVSNMTLAEMASLSDDPDAIAEKAKKRLSNLTAQEVISAADSITAEREALRERERLAAEEALARHEAELERLRRIVTVTPVSKRFSEGRYDDSIVMGFSIKNNSDKEVAGFKGGLTLNDMFGDKIIGLEIKHDDPLAPGEEIVETLYYDYNQFINEHGTWRSTELEKIQPMWEPQMIIFADGTRTEIPAE